MKKAIKKLKSLFFVVVTFTLILQNISCEKEELQPTETQTKSGLNIWLFPGEKVFSHSEAVKQKVLDLKQKKLASRLTSDLYNFSIDETEVQVLFGDDYTQYTFLVERDAPTENVLENYICKVYSDGEVFQYLISYPYTETVDGIVYDGSNSVIQVIEDQNMIINPSGRGFPPGCVPELVSESWQYVCTSIPCTGGNHAFGDVSCDCGITHDCTPASQDCGWVGTFVYGCSGGSSNTLSPGGNGGLAVGIGGGGSGSSSSQTVNPIITVPFKQNRIEIKLLEQLSQEQANWWHFNAPPSVKETIINYLNQNSSNNVINTDAWEFVEEAINAFINGEDCAILPTVFNPSEIEADYDPNFFGDYPAPNVQQNHQAIQQQFNNLRNTNGNLAAVNYLINTYNMNTFGSDTININYSISFANGLPFGRPANAVRGFNSAGVMVSCELQIDTNLFTFTDFGFITRVIKHELYHVLQGEHYGQYGISIAAQEFDAYYYQIFGFRDLKRIQDLDLVCQLAKYMIDFMNQLSNSEKAEKQDEIDLVNQTFPRICNE